MSDPTKRNSNGINPASHRLGNVSISTSLNLTPLKKLVQKVANTSEIFFDSDSSEPSPKHVKSKIPIPKAEIKTTEAVSKKTRSASAEPGTKKICPSVKETTLNKSFSKEANSTPKKIFTSSTESIPKKISTPTGAIPKKRNSSVASVAQKKNETVSEKTCSSTTKRASITTSFRAISLPVEKLDNLVSSATNISATEAVLKKARSSSAEPGTKKTCTSVTKTVPKKSLSDAQSTPKKNSSVSTEAIPKKTNTIATEVAQKKTEIVSKNTCSPATKISPLTTYSKGAIPKTVSKQIRSSSVESGTKKTYTSSTKATPKILYFGEAHSTPKKISSASSTGAIPKKTNIITAKVAQKKTDTVSKKTCSSATGVVSKKTRSASIDQGTKKICNNAMEVTPEKSYSKEVQSTPKNISLASIEEISEKTNSTAPEVAQKKTETVQSTPKNISLASIEEIPEKTNSTAPEVAQKKTETVTEKTCSAVTETAPITTCSSSTGAIPKNSYTSPAASLPEKILSTVAQTEKKVILETKVTSLSTEQLQSPEVVSEKTRPASVDLRTKKICNNATEVTPEKSYSKEVQSTPKNISLASIEEISEKTNSTAPEVAQKKTETVTEKTCSAVTETAPITTCSSSTGAIPKNSYTSPAASLPEKILSTVARTEIKVVLETKVTSLSTEQLQSPEVVSKKTRSASVDLETKEICNSTMEVTPEKSYSKEVQSTPKNISLASIEEIPEKTNSIAPEVAQKKTETVTEKTCSAVTETVPITTCSSSTGAIPKNSYTSPAASLPEKILSTVAQTEKKVVLETKVTSLSTEQSKSPEIKSCLTCTEDQVLVGKLDNLVSCTSNISVTETFSNKTSSTPTEPGTKMTCTGAAETTPKKFILRPAKFIPKLILTSTEVIPKNNCSATEVAQKKTETVSQKTCLTNTETDVPEMPFLTPEKVVETKFISQPTEQLQSPEEKSSLTRTEDQDSVSPKKLDSLLSNTNEREAQLVINAETNDVEVSTLSSESPVQENYTEQKKETPVEENKQADNLVKLFAQARSPKDPLVTLKPKKSSFRKWFRSKLPKPTEEFRKMVEAQIDVQDVFRLIDMTVEEILKLNTPPIYGTEKDASTTEDGHSNIDEVRSDVQDSDFGTMDSETVVSETKTEDKRSSLVTADSDFGTMGSESVMSETKIKETPDFDKDTLYSVSEIKDSIDDDEWQDISAWEEVDTTQESLDDGDDDEWEDMSGWEVIKVPELSKQKIWKLIHNDISVGSMDTESFASTNSSVLIKETTENKSNKSSTKNLICNKQKISSECETIIDQAATVVNAQKEITGDNQKPTSDQKLEQHFHGLTIDGDETAHTQKYDKELQNEQTIIIDPSIKVDQQEPAINNEKSGLNANLNSVDTKASAEISTVAPAHKRKVSFETSLLKPDAPVFQPVSCPSSSGVSTNTSYTDISRKESSQSSSNSSLHSWSTGEQPHLYSSSSEDKLRKMKEIIALSAFKKPEPCNLNIRPDLIREKSARLDELEEIKEGEKLIDESKTRIIDIEGQKIRINKPPEPKLHAYNPESRNIVETIDRIEDLLEMVLTLGFKITRGVVDKFERQEVSVPIHNAMCDVRSFTSPVKQHLKIAIECGEGVFFKPLADSVNTAINPAYHHLNDAIIALESPATMNYVQLKSEPVKRTNLWDQDLFSNLYNFGPQPNSGFMTQTMGQFFKMNRYRMVSPMERGRINPMGLVEIPFQYDLQVGLTIDLGILLMSRENKILIALSADGVLAGMRFRYGEVFQKDESIDFSCANGFSEVIKRARFNDKGVSFQDEMSPLTYLITPAGISSCQPIISSIEPSFISNIFYSGSRVGEPFVAECVELLQFSRFEYQRDDSMNWIIKNIKIKQTTDGQLVIHKHNASYTLVITPRVIESQNEFSTSSRLTTPIIHVTASATLRDKGNKFHMYAKQQGKKLFYSDEKFVARNNTQSAGIDNNHQIYLDAQ